MRFLTAPLVAMLFVGSANGHTPTKTVKPTDSLPKNVTTKIKDADWQFETALTLMKSSKFEEAARWFSKAAAQGHRLAQCNLGALYAQGLGVPKDLPKALRWYRSAAEQGDEMAMYNLGALYAKEERNMSLAVAWFKQSAAKGYAAAQVNLGMLYFRGEGVERNTVLAKRWLLLAGEQNDAGALFSLGVMVLQSLETPVDSVSAFAYFSLSAVYGNEHALAARQQLEATMSVAQVREGQKLARQWKANGIATRLRNQD
jgi:TPR repeat protein